MAETPRKRGGPNKNALIFFRSRDSLQELPKKDTQGREEVEEKAPRGGKNFFETTTGRGKKSRTRTKKGEKRIRRRNAGLKERNNNGGKGKKREGIHSPGRIGNHVCYS